MELPGQNRVLWWIMALISGLLLAVASDMLHTIRAIQTEIAGVQRELATIETKQQFVLMRLERLENFYRGSRSSN